MDLAAERATNLLKVLATKNRLMILCQLTEGEKCVGELVGLLRLRDATVSQHLSLLRKDRLVRPRREGQTVYYSLIGTEARRLIDVLYEIYCAPAQGDPGRDERTASNVPGG